MADLSTMWVQLESRRQTRPVRVGHPVLASRGRASPETRASPGSPRARSGVAHARGRVELPNPDRGLKAGVFVRARIEVAGRPQRSSSPGGAVQRLAGGSLVFVKRTETTFEPVAVKTAGVQGELVEVASGLEADAEVVTTGAFLLKTEIMKEAIGAGCCDLEEKP